MIAIPNVDKPKNAFDCSKKINPEERICIYTGKVFEETLSLLLDRPCDDCPLIEIIPCKDCKNSHMTYDGECKYCDLIRDDDDNFIECYFDSDHFCSYAERK